VQNSLLPLGFNPRTVQPAASPLVPKIAGLNPAEAAGFFPLKNPQHAFLQRGSKAVCPMLQICGMEKNHAIYVAVGIAGQIDWPFLAQFRPSLTEVSHVA
jgi:hypothetical protein